MAIPFLAGAATQSLLNDSKQPTIIHNNFYIPLLEDQANLYMTTAEYKTNLEERCKRVFLYIDRSHNYQAKILVHNSTGEKRKITFDQAWQLIEHDKKLKKRSDKVILMTKGIGGLPKASKESFQASCCSTVALTVICLPFAVCCCREIFCSDEVNMANGSCKITVYQNHFNVLKI